MDRTARPIGAGVSRAAQRFNTVLKSTAAAVFDEVNTMIRILYISQAAPGLSAEQVQEILKSAQRNNAASGLTGVLVHGGGLFMQVLEGPEQTVLRQYVKILDDRRHGDCRILYISPANDRIFEKWSMGMLEADPFEFQEIAALRTRRLEAVQANTFSGAMREFVRMLNAAK